MRAFFRGLVAIGALGCATSSGTTGASDASSDAPAPDADARDGAPSSCPSGIRCGGPGDCAAVKGGVAGCWGCFAECCVPNPEGSDPQKMCADGGTACTPSTCDGNGACTGPLTAKDGTPCGQMCGGVFMYARATCLHGQCVGDSMSQVDCKIECYGDYTPCDQCDSTGCVASCSPLPRPDRCFQ